MKKFKQYRFVAFVLASFLSLPAAAFAGIINVPVDYPSIQEAINNSVNGDTVLVSGGYYVENINFNGKAITLRSEDGAANTFIDADLYAENSVVTFNSYEGASSVIDGFTIEYGFSITGGGGISCLSSSPTIKNCTIAENYAFESNGGGIYCFAASPIIDHCSINFNETANFPQFTNGGAIACFYNSAPTISNCEFSGNRSNGAIYLDSSTASIINCTLTGSAYGAINLVNNSNANITNCILEQNHATGISLDSSTATINDSTISNSDGTGISSVASNITITNCNIYNNYGYLSGGIYLGHDNTGSVQNCNIFSNSGYTNGGGITIELNSTEIINTIISNNSSDDSGGGVACIASSSHFTNCTVTNNSGFYGAGGISCVANASPVLSNSIIWSNISYRSAFHELYVDTNSMLTATYSDIAGGDPANPGSPYPGIGNIMLDPLFNNPAARDYHLLASSPCIDSGIASGAPNTDFDHEARPFNLLYDMGADEYTGNIPPNTPTNIVPMGSGVSLTPTLTASEFSDFDNDLPQSARWQISPAVYDSGVIPYASAHTIPESSALAMGTTYYWRVQYMDNHGNWSSWSQETEFLTCGSYWYKDMDNDGYTDGSTLTQCTQPVGYKLSAASGDCDDNNAAINPTTIWYKDIDNDGYTDGSTLTQCTQPAGYKLSATSGDCNDSLANVHPGAVELCDGIDNNCIGGIDETCIPAAPSNLTLTAVSRTEIRLNWADNSNNEQGFIVIRKSGNCGTTGWVQIATVAANATSYTNQGLSPNTTYSYKVQAYNGAGNSGFTSCATTKTLR